MPHFNDQYPSMEEIKQKRQEDLEYENNALLKEQNQILRELLGKPSQTESNKNKLCSDFSQEYVNKRIRTAYFTGLVGIDYKFKD